MKTRYGLQYPEPVTLALLAIASPASGFGGRNDNE